MKLLRSTENEITKDKSCKNVPFVKINELVLFYCNIVNNNYQQDSTVLYTFVPNKPFGSLFIFLKTFKSEFQEIDVWFTDQSSQTLVEDKINLALLIK